MNKRRLAKRKLSALAEDVGADHADAYLAAAILRLMHNYQLVNFHVV